MGHLVITIIPIFALVALGNIAQRRGFLPETFMVPANRLVYYLAIPAMIFRAISKASITQQFNVVVLGLTLTAVICVFVIGWVGSRLTRLPATVRGTFIQSSIHGNLGYIGLAVAFYYLGSDGLARASILAAFMMILQNFVAVVVIQSHRPHNTASGRLRSVTAKIQTPEDHGRCGFCA